MCIAATLTREFSRKLGAFFLPPKTDISHLPSSYKLLLDRDTTSFTLHVPPDGQPRVVTEKTQEHRMIETIRVSSLGLVSIDQTDLTRYLTASSQKRSRSPNNTLTGHDDSQRVTRCHFVLTPYYLGDKCRHKSLDP